MGGNGEWVLDVLVAPYGGPYGGRDAQGEYFTPDTDLESEYTKSGVVFVDWEHGQDSEPGPGDVLGVVDWKSARVDERGVWVERVLNRRSRYVRWLEPLIAGGLIGTSSEAVPEETEKAADGAILRWPVRRDTLTVQPMEPRMMTENQLQAFKALGLVETDAGTAGGGPLEHSEAAQGQEQEAEAAPEADSSAAAVAVAKARARLQTVKNSLEELR